MSNPQSASPIQTNGTSAARTWRIWAVASLAVLVLLGIGFAGWHLIKRPPTARYDPIIAAVAAGTISENTHAPIDLPANLRGITDRDQILVSKRPDGSFMIVFPTSHPGVGAELVGLLYTSRPLTGADTSPNLGAVEFTKPIIRCGSYGHLMIDDRLDEHWYRVSAAMRQGT